MMRKLIVLFVVVGVLAASPLAMAGSSSSRKKPTPPICKLWVLNVNNRGKCFRAGPFPTYDDALRARSWIICTYGATVSYPFHPCGDNSVPNGNTGAGGA